ncbi:aromatic-ring-hydroxylating dioxygenase subunit beta [Alloalcanivorax sp. C16-2]|uniref:aromatic-ring-hydroxylating dioxygenase subunit beta n=1 Tax=Alloalcanivorax TaxID=3020832 RepID=UPI001932BB3F|nr:aromatic-ring-hydroxylating dioxygenase subunit beta [Alloalcanivorax marinus]MBL7249596.1 aromatic-ring-hydroxylating dioxygenase subunit beta [Alloalcanivorax marinus]
MTSPIDGDLYQRVQDLYQNYGHAIDVDDLEAWPEFFTADARYCVIPRENHDRGLPAALIDCRGRPMLLDRVVALRTANIYNIHFDRHLVSPAVITGRDGDVLESRVNFTVMQTDQSGVTRLFAAGVSYDRIRVEEQRLRFLDRRLVLDTYGVPELLATPL